MKRIAKRLCPLLAALLLLAGLSGCRFFDVFSVDSLLRPPKLTGENAEIQKAFEETVGRDALLMSPLTGDWRSAFLPFDYDDDGFDETLVFYARAEAPDEIHLHFMDHDGSAWYSAGDVAGNGSEVYRVEFANVDGDDRREILVSWTVSDTKRNKTLTVYKYGGEAGFSQMTALQIYEYLALDLERDGESEILYLSSDAAVQPQVIKATVIKTDPATGEFAPLSETELSHSVEFPLQCLYDTAEGRTRIYYDCINFDDTYLTELLVFDPQTDSLYRPQDADGNFLCQQTHRSVELYARQSGGGVAVPVRSVYPGGRLTDSESDLETDLFVTEYMRLETEGFVSLGGKYVYLPAEGYRVRVDAFLENYTAEYRPAQRELCFSLRETPETPAFTIRFYTQDEAGDRTPPYRVFLAKPGSVGDVTQQQAEAAIEKL